MAVSKPTQNMRALHDVSRDLDVPVMLLWKWVIQGHLQASLEPSSGYGLEYYLSDDQVSRAEKLRDLAGLWNSGDAPEGNAQADRSSLRQPSHNPSPSGDSTRQPTETHSNGWKMPQLNAAFKAISKTSGSSREK